MILRKAEMEATKVFVYGFVHFSKVHICVKSYVLYSLFMKYILKIM